MTVATYIRVSTEQQRDDASHIKQRKRIAEWAEREGYDTGDWAAYHTEDGSDVLEWEGIDGEQTGDLVWHEDIAISGQSDERGGYKRLMESYEQHDAVVVRELSRFGRDPMTVMQDAEAIIESDTDFVSITESFDSSSAMGRAFLRIVSVINGMYADLRREQAIKAAERRKEEGKPVGRPKKLDDELRRETFDLREKGVSYQAIARIMESKPNGPEEISRETIRRYCDEADIEPAAQM